MKNDNYLTVSLMSVKEVHAKFLEQERRLNELEERVKQQLKRLSETPVPQKRITSFMPHIAVIAAIVMVFVLLYQKID